MPKNHRFSVFLSLSLLLLSSQADFFRPNKMPFRRLGLRENKAFLKFAVQNPSKSHVLHIQTNGNRFRPQPQAQLRKQMLTPPRAQRHHHYFMLLGNPRPERDGGRFQPRKERNSRQAGSPSPERSLSLQPNGGKSRTMARRPGATLLQSCVPRIRREHRRLHQTGI